MATKPRTDWDDIPNTHRNAQILEDDYPVRNARVIHLSRASIRCTEVSGTFLLAPDAGMQTYAGKQRIEVQCLWFGRKPPTSWMHITVLSSPQYEDNYTGKVVWNIGRPRSS